MTDSMLARVSYVVEEAADKAGKVGAARVDEREFAKRVLIALRDHSAEMISAAESEMNFSEGQFERAWRAAIDAALAGG